MQLFWVSSRDRVEDWFVVAESNREAKSWFEVENGYDENQARAVRVMSLEDQPRVREGWAPEALLKKLGADISKKYDGTRVVTIGGRTFSEFSS